jgi:hypothetical protein
MTYAICRIIYKRKVHSMCGTEILRALNKLAPSIVVKCACDDDLEAD